MAKFICEKCNYRVEKEKIPFRCPYCGKENTMKREQTAQDLLNEVLKNPNEFE